MTGRRAAMIRRRDVTILDAMDDPKLFAPFFKGTSWHAWRVFLAALFALPMDDSMSALYRDLTGRQTTPAVPFREAALIIGRRGGKSRILATIAVYLAVFRNYAPHLAPGEMATIAIIAADRRQARSIFRFIAGLLEAVPMLKAMIAEKTAETITLNNRVQIEIATASFRVTRGYSFAAVLADETAFWRSEDSVNPDVEIFAALRPGLSTIPGSVLLNASSPYRKRGVLYSTYAKFFGRDDGRVLVLQAPTLTMNPSLALSIVQEAYEEDAESAAAEYGAQFRNDLDDFVSREIVGRVTPPDLIEIAPLSGLSYVAFTDAAGGSGTDSMTLAIAHREGDSAVLDCVREIKPPFSPEAATAEFAATLRSYGVKKVRGDRYAGDWPAERFRTHGISYEPSEAPKSAIYLDFLPMLNSGRCQLLDVKRLTNQLCALERRTARSGRDSIDHPPGAHDDVANAVAGALLMAGTQAQARPARRVYFDFMSR